MPGYAVDDIPHVWKVNNLTSIRLGIDYWVEEVARAEGEKASGSKPGDLQSGGGSEWAPRKEARPGIAKIWKSIRTGYRTRG